MKCSVTALNIPVDYDLSQEYENQIFIHRGPSAKQSTTHHFKLLMQGSSYHCCSDRDSYQHKIEQIPWISKTYF